MKVEHYNYYIRLFRQVPYSLVRRVTKKRCHGWELVKRHFADKLGLEIGGPSSLFRADHLIPVYSLCRRIDACNFSTNTLWNKSQKESMFGRNLGDQFVGEACNLSSIASGQYDFLIASHVLEHTANPLRALHEWKRVLRSDGVVTVAVPHRAAGFDHRRKFTDFEHLEADFLTDVGEDDLTHLEEVLAGHDLSLDLPAGSFESFRFRCLKNPSIRAMHHHVFSPEVLVMMFSYVGFRVLNLTIERPCHIIAFGENVVSAKEQIWATNQQFLNSTAEWRKRDPFGYLEGCEG